MNNIRKTCRECIYYQPQGKKHNHIASEWGRCENKEKRGIKLRKGVLNEDRPQLHGKLF